MMLATKYLGIPIRVATENGAAIVWTLRHPFVSLARLNHNIQQLRIDPADIDLIPSNDMGGLHILLLTDCFT